MSLIFVIKYDKEESWRFDGVDAYWGTKSLAAIAQIFLLVIHATINDEVVVKAPAAKGFRVVLGKSRDGSWEQLISLVPSDPETVALLKDLGKSALYDVLKWALLSAVGVPFVLNSRKAKKRVRELEQEVDDLQERLQNAVRDVHLPVKNQNLVVTILGGRTVLAEFNRETLEYLETEVESDQEELIYVGVSRFNARTGWGRCIESIDSISIPFSPAKSFTSAQKTRLVDALRVTARAKFQAVPMLVSKITSKSGQLKRYRVFGIPEVD